MDRPLRRGSWWDPAAVVVIRFKKWPGVPPFLRDNDWGGGGQWGKAIIMWQQEMERIKPCKYGEG